MPYERFSEVVHEKNEYARRIKELESEVAEFKRLKETAKEIKDVSEIDMDKMSIEEYNQTMIKIAENKAYERFKKERELEAAEENQRRIISEFSSRMSKAVSENPELSDASRHVGEYADQIPGYIQESIIEDENGPWIIWELATQKGLIESLSNMKPGDAIRKLGKISAKYDNRDFAKQAEKQVQKEVVKEFKTYEPKETITKSGTGTPQSVRTSTTIPKYNSGGDLRDYKEWRKNFR